MGSSWSTPSCVRASRTSGRRATSSAASTAPRSPPPPPGPPPPPPPSAGVGEPEAQVRARPSPAVATTPPLAYVPRAGAVHKTTGFVKFIASSIDERVLGVHVIGESAPGIIHEAAMAMHFQATPARFLDLIHVYP